MKSAKLEIRNPEALIEMHRLLCDESRLLMSKKNRDYAGGDDQYDPFANLREDGANGIRIRLSDKIARMKSYDKLGRLEVSEEGVMDLCHDVINYAILWALYHLTKDDAGESGPPREASGEGHR